MTNKKERKILRKALSLTLAMLVSILGIPLAKPQQVSATETSDPKFLSSMTITATALSSWDTNYDTKLYATLTGSGYTNSYKTEATALEISSATELAAFARAVNVGKKDFSGKYIKLTASIDLGGTNPTVTKKVDESDSSKFSLNITDTASNVWVPIGNDTTQFKGNFNGNGKEVSNMTVLMKDTSGNVYGGLFGYANGKSIQNTGVTGNVYASSSSSSSFVYAGGLVGFYNSSLSSISNSYVTGNVYASSSSSVSAGGLAGYSSDGSISNSYVTGNIYASSSYVHAGGLVGYIYKISISNSYATGNVYASSSSSSNVYAGGLVGSNMSGSITNGYYYSGATIDGGTGATISKDGTGLTMDQMTGTGTGRADKTMTGLNASNWAFQADGTGIKYLPRLKVITYNETTNPVPRFLTLSASDFDFKAPDNLTYNGSTKKATVTSKFSEVTNDKITIKYYKDEIETSPIDVGTYIVKIDVDEGGNYEAKNNITADHWTFTIAKADPTIGSTSTTAAYKPGLILSNVTPPPCGLGLHGRHVDVA